MCCQEFEEMVGNGNGWFQLSEVSSFNPETKVMSPPCKEWEIVGDEGGTICTLKFCPFCGTKLKEQPQ